MKYTNILIITSLILAGCSAPKITPVTQGTGNAPQDAAVVTQSSLATQASSGEKNATSDIVTKSSDLIEISKDMITKKEDVFKVLEVYKQMVLIYPAQSKERQDVLKYIMDTNLAMVKEGKGQDALRLALELDKLIPKDFYVQNRIIGAYRVLTEEQMDKKNYIAAMDLIRKGLTIRFDQDIMSTKLKLLTLMAQDDIVNKKIDSAKQKLNEVLSIIEAQDSQAEKDIYSKEGTEASRILNTLK